MPNFLVLGTLKAGTTSLYRYLEQHPDIYMSPIKEPKFFALEGRKLEDQHRRILGGCITHIDDYRALFQGVTNEKAVGEVSPMYLSSRQAPERIHHYIPEARLIAILRHPVARAYSHYLHNIRAGHETRKSFLEALRHDAKATYWNYVTIGSYHASLSRYFDHFPAERIKVYLYEDYQADAIATVQDMFRFLGVDDAFVPDTSIMYNTSALPRSRKLYEFLKRSHPIKDFLKPVLPKGFRKSLARNIKKINLETKLPKITEDERRGALEFFRSDILKLEGLIKRDLSSWLEYRGRVGRKVPADGRRRDQAL